MPYHFRFTSNVSLILNSSIILVFAYTYWHTLKHWVMRWLAEPEYGHGFLLVACSLYILWQQRVALQQPWRQSYLCVWVLIVAVALFWVGTLAALYLALQLSFIVMLVSMAIAWFGPCRLRYFMFPLTLLVLSIPLPYFLEAQLTAKLQLLSSQLAVTLIQWFGMPVYLQGNVIDLGAIQLEVVEACSGLRYLYPLLSLGVLVSYFYVSPWWRRALVVLSTIPLTLIMNSARIAITAWLVDRFGADAAEGFFHDFEGLVIFLVCMIALVLEIVLLEYVFSRRSLWQVLDFERAPVAHARGNDCLGHDKRGPIVAVLGTLIVMAIWGTYENYRDRPTPVANIVYFPMQWGPWQGRHIDLPEYKISRLQVDEYFLANFSRAGDSVPVNLYVAFYGHQSAGVSPHSPKVCMPGGGWNISRFDVADGILHSVNEVVIERRDEKQLVRYWFVERGRPMVDEYQRKWFLLKDAMLSGRTDGALVRFTTPILPSERIVDARTRLQALESLIAAPLRDFLPGQVDSSH